MEENSHGLTPSKVYSDIVRVVTNNDIYNPNQIYFKKLDPEAIVPTKGTSLSAGWDLYALADTKITGGQGSVIVPTGISVMIPQGYYGRIAMRSGLAVKQHLAVSAGVIDRDYAGPIGVVTFHTFGVYTSTGASPVAYNNYTIKKGERFAQLIIEQCHYGDCKVVDEFPTIAKDTFSPVPHGANVTTHAGFGSTGKN
jgi:deoxyuridine 5'-triphosphate nucleotidohydrolase